MKRWYGRICWNSNDWVFPSGQAKEQRDTYVSRTGFGHEEWLFNFSWLIDGYHYAFLQPVSRSFKKVTGTTVGVLLYAINLNRDRLYVGEIRDCRVLTQAQAEAALKHYRKSGWLKSMKEQIGAVGGDTAGLGGDPLSIFNVRFRPADADYSPRLADPSDLITRLNRYTLVEANENVVATQWRRTRKGTNVLPIVQMVTRSGQPGVMYDPMHPQLQGELMTLLKARFGENNVIRESDFVDISISNEQKKILIEIKSDSQARIAIRKALGQILEYAYFEAGSSNDSAELVIVAPGPLTGSVSDYLNRLHARFGIPVTYCSFSLGDQMPSLFADHALRET